MTEDTSPALPAEQQPPQQRRRWPWAVACAALFLVGVGVGGAPSSSEVTPVAAPAQPTETVTLPAPPAETVAVEVPAPVPPAETVTVEVPAPEPVAEPAAAEGSIGNGVHVVGVDIEPGTYRTDGPSDDAMGFCYWARLSDTSGEFDSIITNGAPMGPATVTIDPSDGAFDSSGCQPWEPA